MSISSIRNDFDIQLRIAEEMQRRQANIKPLISDNPPLEGRPMPAPNSIKGLPGRLRDHIAKLTARAEATAGDFEKSVSNLHSRLDDTDKMKKEIDNAAAEIQQITGMDNGGPTT